MIRYRARAFFIHLLASALVVGTSIVLMHAAWYPGALAALQGWAHLLWVVVGVDLVLGPCLTFVVYAPGKKSLRFDLTVIVLVQFAALAYGIYTSAIGRPVYLVFLKDRFEVVTAREYPNKELAAAKGSPFVDFPWFGPKPVFTEMPRDRAEANRILFSAVAGEGLRVMPRYYQPYAQAAQAAIASGKTLPAIEKLKPEQAKAVGAWIQDENRKPASVVFVPLQAKLGYGLVMLDSRSGEIVDIKGIDPLWY